jgi:hypothetical protein
MSKAKVTKILVNCKDFNGYKNGVFMMKSDDFRLTNSYMGNVIEFGYTKIADGKFNTKERKFITDAGDTYQVFSDWSVKKI